MVFLPVRKLFFEGRLYNSLAPFTPLGIISVIPARSCKVKDNVQVTIATKHTLKVVE
jgi:hypothetical protein